MNILSTLYRDVVACYSVLSKEAGKKVNSFSKKVSNCYKNRIQIEKNSLKYYGGEIKKGFKATLEAPGRLKDAVINRLPFPL